MDSSLYYIKQQFTLGAWKALTTLPLDTLSPEYTQTLLYQARAFVALEKPQDALNLLGVDNTSLSIRAIRALAKYIARSDTEKALDELRDLSVEIEEEGVDEKEKGLVRVLAGTAFAREGEVEEALVTLGAGSNTENLEAVSLIVQIYLSINRVDLAKKEFERARKWAEDDLLLQSIEASLGLLTGKDSYINPHTFYVEQLHNPSLTSPHLLTSRGVTHLLRGEVPEAQSDFAEAIKSMDSASGDALAGSVVAAELTGSKENVDAFWSRLQSEYPEHPLVISIMKKDAEFDQLSTTFTIPPPAIVAS